MNLIFDVYLKKEHFVKIDVFQRLGYSKNLGLR